MLNVDRAATGVRVRKALPRYTVSTIGKRTDNFSALRDYLFNYNTKRMGNGGLGHIHYQRLRLRELLNKNESLKFLIDADFVLEDVNNLDGNANSDEVLTPIRSRRYSILNEEDLNKAVKNAGNDIILALENKKLEKSGLRVKKINEITIHDV